ncbi:MAG: transposase [Muricomes sp.]
MPRDKRRESKTGVYHIIVRGNNKEKIFERDNDKIAFKTILKKAVEEYPVTIYAYCIMGNHAHIMLETVYDILPRLMQRINSTYAEGYNAKYDRCGHVFQGRYYSDCVETEEYYWCCLRYIHNNPVKVYIVKEPFDYTFSSARDYRKGGLELIGESSFNMLRMRFQNMDEFWDFHRLFEQKSFLDTVEDERIHNYERVRILAGQYLSDNHIEKIETLLTVGSIKKKFLEACKKQTGLSQRKIENILTMECKGVRPL